MLITPDNYRIFPAVSNSDLGWLDNYMNPKADDVIDKEKAYKFGTLIDAIITEPHRVNYYKLLVDKVKYESEDFELAKVMKKVWDKDAFCQSMQKQCSFQHISYQPAFSIEHEGVNFALPAKCKWDLFCRTYDMGGDIKSTAAETQKQFEEACHHFGYYRSRAWYMDLENRNNDILIGISKKNFKIFKIPIKRGDKLYNLGKQQYEELAFKYWCYFGNIK